MELNLRKQKWVIITIYKPPVQDVRYFLYNLSLIIDYYSRLYDRYLVMGDFNNETVNPAMSEFMEHYELSCLTKGNTCFKSPQGSCIDLMLTNCKSSFKHSCTFQTGLSDWHSMVYSMLRITYEKIPAKKFIYRNYKYFIEEDFLNDLSSKLEFWNTNIYSIFQNIFESTLDQHAPYKQKVIRGNSKPHMSKNLRKEIMKRSRLKNVANRTKNAEDINSYKRQRNIVVRLNKKQKSLFFKTIDTSGKKRSLWQICKPYFSNKPRAAEQIILVESDTILTADFTIANVFNTYFCNITKTLNIPLWEPEVTLYDPDPIKTSINKYSTHPSVLQIKSRQSKCHKFDFSYVSNETTKSYIMKLDESKKTSGNIPTRVLKLSSDVCCNTITNCINTCIENSVFPDELKYADIRPCHKKDSETDKANYRPISILSTVSKVFERILYDQLEKFFCDKLSKFLCGFRKDYSTQHALLHLLQNWQKCLDTSGLVGTILMDLSKAYDCLSHELVIAKLEAYGLSIKSLRLIRNFLTNRKQRVKIGSKFSAWLEILLGVPQGSILGPLLFNIFINDIFLFIFETDICNFADDTTIYACDTNLSICRSRLEKDITRAIKWYNINSMVANPANFQMMFLGKGTEQQISIEANGTLIESTEKVKLLGITIDKKLSFSEHISLLCKYANNKTNALLRIRNYVDTEKARALCYAYTLSTFNYCPLIWMFCNKTSNKKLEQTHKRALRTVFQRYDLSLEDLLSLDGSVKIHTKNLRCLMIEIYKCLNNLNPEFMWNIFNLNENPQNLSRQNNLILPPTNTKTYGTYGFLFRTAYIWNNLPNYNKNVESLQEFKSRIRTWKCDNSCSCRICR